MLRARRLKHRGRAKEAHALYAPARKLPSQDPTDPDYRRLHYVRYADDWLLGFAGPKEEAEAIKEHLRIFLRDHLKLELAADKTLLTHATSQTARFLGDELSSAHADSKRDQRGRRSGNGHSMLSGPWDVSTTLCSRYDRRGNPEARADMLDATDFSIVGRSGAELRGSVN